MLCKLYTNYIKTSKQRVLKTIMKNFSRKEKAITRSQKSIYIYIYL